MPEVLAIIPARGGSKGIPKKNIKILGGFPLIAYSIVAAKKSQEIDRVIVSTDSEEIAEIAKNYGAEVPFLRPAEFSQDKSPDKDFVLHALKWFKENENYEPDYIVHLRPTTPLREPSLIDKSINLIKENREATSLRSGHELPESPYKFFKKNKDFFVGFFEEFDGVKDYTNLPRQVFPKAYHPNGYVDVLKTKFILKNNSLHGQKIIGFETPFVIEVDDIESFERLEFEIKTNGSKILDYLDLIFPEKKVKRIYTKFRKIITQIPNTNLANVFETLKKYETRCMHGQLPIVWDKAKDFQIWDKDGNCWIDFTSTIFVANTGHANPRIKKYIQYILDKNLMHSYTYATEIRAKYLKKLIEFTPKQFEKAFLLSSGTEATECAVKLMRMQGKKKGIVSFEGAMHGRTMCAAMMGGSPESRAWIGYEDPNIHRIDFPYPWALNGMSGRKKFLKDMEELKSKGIDFDKDIAGFMVEAYIGWGAVFLPYDYIQELYNFAKEHNILVCIDEIQGGFGRTGKLFVYQHYGIEPDLICCGKGISSSLPLSAVLGSQKIMDTPEIGSMSSTHSANPLCCAAGLANIEEIEEKNLIEESARKGKILHSRLNELKEKYPERISYILGGGLLAGILFINPKTKEPDANFATKVCNRALQKGLLLIHTGRESIKMGPPLTIPDDALIEGLEVFEECVKEIDNESG